MIECKFVDAADDRRVFHQFNINDYEWMSDDIAAKQVMLEDVVREAARVPKDWKFRIKLFGARFHGTYHRKTRYSAEGQVAGEGLSIFVRPPVLEFQIPSLEEFRAALAKPTVAGRL